MYTLVIRKVTDHCVLIIALSLFYFQHPRFLNAWFTIICKQSLFSERKISESKGDPKKLWRNLSYLMRKGKAKPPTSDELTAERFLEAFNEKLAGVRSSTASADPPVFNGPPCEFSCVEFEPVDATSV